MKNVLIVGAGLAGTSLARILAESSSVQVTIIDKRDHIAGNAFDFTSDDGFRIHKYGPHLFHTNSKKVYEWLSQFTEWVPYKHKVKAMLDDGSLVTLPPNKHTAERIGQDQIVDVLFRPYTKKMWGMDIEELDPSILKRVPIRSDDNEYYFPEDKYQFLPSKGYTAMVENILDHPNITVLLSTPFEKEMEQNYDHVFNSMPIDEYYEYCFGELPYRSIKFHHNVLLIPKLFDVATINFTNNEKFTRVTEWKNLPENNGNKHLTHITFEEPCCYTLNNFERYYPVKDVSGENSKNYRKYKKIDNQKTTFIGRCGRYVYIDMHQAVSMGLQEGQHYINRINNR